MPTSKLISFFTRALLSIVLILIGLGVFLLLWSTKPLVSINTDDRAYPAVVVMEAKKVDVSRRIIGYGTADAHLHVDVPSQINSTVLTLPSRIRVGQSVKKGELLFELESVDFNQQVIRAESSIQTALSDLAILEVERNAAEQRAELAQQDASLSESELQRIRQAFDKGAAKQREIDIAKQKTIAATSAAVNATEAASRFPSLEEKASSAISIKQAELSLAQENLKRCRIVAPIDGVIQYVDVRVGEHVTNGQRVARIVNSDLMEISLRIPSFARSHISSGDPVFLRSAGFGKRYWEARVSRIAPEDDSKTRTLVVFVDVDQNSESPSRIPPGLFLRGEIVNTSTEAPRWVVPRRSIRDDRILVVRDSLLRSLPVSIDFSITGAIENLSLPDLDWAVLNTQLMDGDFIVVDPGGTLRDGMSVRALVAGEVSGK